MANFEVIMPKLGESIIEATIVRWLKKPGEAVVEDESVADLATDKVDSEIPSPVAGILVKTSFNEGDGVPVGKVIALIDMGGDDTVAETNDSQQAAPLTAASEVAAIEPEKGGSGEDKPVSGRFYSPQIGRAHV